MVNAILGMNYDLSQTLARMQQQINGISTQPILLHASTGQDGGQGLSTDKNGLHLFNPAGVEDVTLSALDGSATFAGPVTILGTLNLPNGSVNNAALLSPTTPAVASGAATNFAVTTTPTTMALATYTVPAGFTSATVTVNCVVGAINPTTAGDFLYSSAIINGVSSNEMFGYAAPSNGSVAVPTTKASILTGLTGGSTFTVAVSLHAGTAWTASTSNRAFVESSAIFYR